MMKSGYFFNLKNYRAALAAALFFGCIAPGAKFFISTMPPQSLAGIMYFSAGLGLFFVLLFKKQLRSSFLQLQRRDLKWFAAATIFGGILGPAFLTYGIARISGSTASLLLNFEAVSTSLIAWLVFREHFEKRIAYGMVAILIGCLILSFNSQAAVGVDTNMGVLLICLACLSWGIDNNVTRSISHLDPTLIASFKGLIAGGTNLFLGYFIGERLIWGSEIWQTGLLGFLGIGISLVAFITSLGLIGTARTGAVFSTAPFVGSILSLVFLKESPTLPFALALLFMAAGVWLHLSEDHEHEHTHEELEHSHEHTHDDHHQHEHRDQDPVGNQHSHRHKHKSIRHKHSHFPDIHHQHKHSEG